MPLGIGLVYLILAFNRFRVSRIWIGLGVFLCILFTNYYVVRNAIHLWEVPSVKLETVAPKKVAVVLTGGLFTLDDTIESNLHVGSHSDRMFQAFRLYQAKKVDKILISGGDLGGLFSNSTSESILARNYFMLLGIPKEDIWVENQARNTFENAKFSIELLKKNGISPNQVYLVTSALHMRRSLACFQKQGFLVEAFATNPIASRKPIWFWIDIIPSHYAFMDSYHLMHEWLGYVTYAIMGYL